MTNNNSEQWKLDGNCDICRRNNYCSKPCTIAKKKSNKELYNFVASAMFASFIGRPDDEIQEKGIYLDE